MEPEKVSSVLFGGFPVSELTGLSLVLFHPEGGSEHQLDSSNSLFHHGVVKGLA